MMRPVVTACCVLAASFAARTARADRTGLPSYAPAPIEPGEAESSSEAKVSASKFAFGLFPALRAGKSWAEYSQAGPQGSTASQSSTVLDLDMTGLLVVPGDLFAVGVVGGYTLTSESETAPSGLGTLSYSGWHVSPTAMVGFGRLSLAGRAGYQSTTVDLATSSYDTEGFRFGGGIAFVLYQNYGSDLSLGLDVSRIQADDVTIGQRRVGLSATTLTLGLSCAFQPDALAL